MADRKEKVYNFSYCLFAYLYKDYNETTKLPIDLDYTVQTHKYFIEDVAKCIVHAGEHFNSYLKPSLFYEFSKNCKSEETFFGFMKWYYYSIVDKINTKCLSENDGRWDISDSDITAIKILILSSFILKLTYYLFDKGCFFFISSAPSCLAEILLSMPDTFDVFYSVNCFLHWCKQNSIKRFYDSSDVCVMLQEQDKLLVEYDYSKFSLMDHVKTGCGASDIEDTTVFKKLDSLNIEVPNNKETSDAFNRGKITSGVSLENDPSSGKSAVGISFVLEKLNSLKVAVSNDQEISTICTKRKASLEGSPENDISNTALHKAKCLKYFPHEFSDDSSSTSGSSFVCDDVDEFLGPISSLTYNVSENLKCEYCNEVCLSYLEEFIDDFKEMYNL